MKCVHGPQIDAANWFSASILSAGIKPGCRSMFVSHRRRSAFLSFRDRKSSRPEARIIRWSWVQPRGAGSRCRRWPTPPCGRLESKHWTLGTVRQKRITVRKTAARDSESKGRKWQRRDKNNSLPVWYWCRCCLHPQGSSKFDFGRRYLHRVSPQHRRSFRPLRRPSRLLVGLSC